MNAFRDRLIERTTTKRVSSTHTLYADVARKRRVQCNERYTSTHFGLCHSSLFEQNKLHLSVADLHLNHYHWQAHVHFDSYPLSVCDESTGYFVQCVSELVLYFFLLCVSSCSSRARIENDDFFFRIFIQLNEKTRKNTCTQKPTDASTLNGINKLFGVFKRKIKREKIIWVRKWALGMLDLIQNEQKIDTQKEREPNVQKKMKLTCNILVHANLYLCKYEIILIWKQKRKEERNRSESHKLAAHFSSEHDW